MTIAALSIAGVAGYTSYTSTQALAQDSESRPLLLQRLIEKFNLNPTEVDQVAEDVRNERMVQHQQLIGDKLSKLVSDGKINEDQKAKILAKLEEWKNNKEDWKNLSAEERKSKMEEHMKEMGDFADSMGVDLKTILGGFHPRMGFPMGRHWDNN